MSYSNLPSVVSVSRRAMLRSTLLLAVPAVFGSAIFSAAAAVFIPPSRARGTARVDVRNKGATGNGTTDDTTAFQNAINSLPATGGTIYVPAGTYLIDAERSIKLRSRNHLQLAPDATLVAKPTANESYNVVLADSVSDIEISGGRIIGERDDHKATIGEGGHGIRIRGCSRVTIRDIHISKGWGDGICVGPKPVWKSPYIYSRDVVVANVVCTRNRRNGLSIGNVIGMRVFDSEFSYTQGTTPQCGIDVEPDKGIDGNGYCDDVHIENCVIRGNEKYGINMWRRASGVTLKGCLIEKNLACGMVTTGVSRVVITGNTVNNNGSTGMFIQKENRDVQVFDNIFFTNYTKQTVKPRTAFYLVGVNNTVQKDLKVGVGDMDNVNIQVGRNYFR